MEIYSGPDEDRHWHTRFGRIGEPPKFVDGELWNVVNPIILVRAVYVGIALLAGGDDSYGGVVSTVSPDGMFRIDSASGSWVWELFPARWSHDEPYDPALYVAVWRD